MGKRELTAIVVNGFKENKNDDVIIQELWETGEVLFNDLRTVFNGVIKDKGLRLTVKERKIKTNELMEGTTEIADADAMLKIVAMLQDKLKVASTKAMGSLRTWAKENEIVLPKVAKESKPRKVGFSGHYEKILNEILAQRDAGTEMDKKAVVAFCHAEGIPEAYSTTALNVVHFAKRWSGEIAEEAAEETTEAA